MKSGLEYLIRNTRQLGLNEHGLDAIRGRTIYAFSCRYPGKEGQSIIFFIPSKIEGNKAVVKAFVKHQDSNGLMPLTEKELKENEKEIRETGFCIASYNQHSATGYGLQFSNQFVVKLGTPFIEGQGSNITINDDFSKESVTLFTAVGYS